jgi:hypothetical protein
MYFTCLSWFDHSRKNNKWRIGNGDQREGEWLYKFHFGTDRNDRNTSYRHLDRHRRASIPYRIKYRSMLGNTGHSGQYRPKCLFRLFRSAAVRLPDSVNSFLEGPCTEFMRSRNVWLMGRRVGWDVMSPTRLPDTWCMDPYPPTRLVARCSLSHRHRMASVRLSSTYVYVYV